MYMSSRTVPTNPRPRHHSEPINLNFQFVHLIGAEKTVRACGRQLSRESANGERGRRPSATNQIQSTTLIPERFVMFYTLRV